VGINLRYIFSRSSYDIIKKMSLWDTMRGNFGGINPSITLFGGRSSYDIIKKIYEIPLPTPKLPYTVRYSVWQIGGDFIPRLGSPLIVRQLQRSKCGSFYREYELVVDMHLDSVGGLEFERHVLRLPDVA